MPPIWLVILILEETNRGTFTNTIGGLGVGVSLWVTWRLITRGESISVASVLAITIASCSFVVGWLIDFMCND